MQFDFSRWGPLTVLIVALVLIGAAAGAVIVIVQPSTLAFDSYLSDISKFVLGLGVLGVGHALVKKTPAVQVPSAWTTSSNPGAQFKQVNPEPSTTPPLLPDETIEAIGQNTGSPPLLPDPEVKS